MTLIDAAVAVRLPTAGGPELLLLKAQFLAIRNLRRARTRADDTDPRYLEDLAALRVLTELGFVEHEQLCRWEAECSDRCQIAIARSLTGQETS